MKWLRSGLFGTAALLGLGAMIAIPAQAEPISPAFDGQYQGSGQLLSYMSQGSCKKAPGDYKIRISNGNIRGRAKDGDRMSGFVTKGGFFTGTYHFADGTKSTIQGQVDHNSAIGGVFKGETCAYLLTLNKQKAM